MNKIALLGNLTRDPERKNTTNGTAVTTFTIAVQRKYKNQSGEYEADFINCVAWRALADLIANSFSKGSKIALTGSVQTRSYDDNGKKRYATEVVVEEIDFLEKKKASAPTKPANDDYDLIPVDDAELPF